MKWDYFYISFNIGDSNKKKTRTNIHQTISDISKESKFTCVCRSCSVLRSIFLYIDILLLLLLIRLVMVMIHNQIFMSEDLYRGFFSTRLSIGLRITLDIANVIRNLLNDVHVSLSVSLFCVCTTCSVQHEWTPDVFGLIILTWIYAKSNTCWWSVHLGITAHRCDNK